MLTIEGLLVESLVKMDKDCYLYPKPVKDQTHFYGNIEILGSSP